MLAIARRVLGIVVTTSLVALLAGMAVLFWLVREQGWLVQTVATGSMGPAVPTGSVLLSRPVDPAEVRVGDVLVFRSPSGATVAGGDDGVFLATEAMLISHRVVAVETGPDGLVGFRTRGDANDQQDPWTVTPDMVRARYVAHVPGIGAVLAQPGFRRGAYLTMAAAGLVVGAVATRSLVREIRAERARARAGRDPVGAPREASTEVATRGPTRR